MRSISAIDRADVCLILIDANDGVTEQDTKIAGLVHEAGKAAVIVVNKWDAVENKETNTMRDMEAKVRQGLSYMLYAPVLFLSALTGQRVDRLFQVIQDVHAQNTSRITTGALNSVLADATARVQPPTDKGRRLKIFYMTQASTKPPHFVIFCNDAHLKGIDHELKFWGDHAIAGTEGAKVIPELEVCESDYIVPKRRYSGFFHTDLDLLLRELGVNTVVLTGLHTHMCVRHTAADAYQLGYDVVAIKDATNSFTAEDYEYGLSYLKGTYDAEITDTDTFLASL